MGVTNKKTLAMNQGVIALAVSILAGLVLTGCTPSDAPDMQSEQAKAEQNKQLEEMAKSGKGPVDEGMPGGKL